jgi:nucleoside-diphosphate-sugar epimerase
MKTIDEKTPCKPTIPHEKCKYQTEQLIKKYAKIKKFHFSILRPSIVYGEGGFGDSYILVEMIKKSRVILPGNGENITPWVYVGNVVDAAILLMKKGKNEEYIINHKEKISFNRIIKFITKKLNKKIKIIHIPIFLLTPTVYFIEKICFLFNISPFINMYRLKSMTSDRLYSIKKIEDLGYTEKINFDIGMRKTIDWYNENEYL